MGRELGEVGGCLFFPVFFSFLFFLLRCDLLRNTGLTGSVEALITLTMVIPFYIPFVSQNPTRRDRLSVHWPQS